MDGLVGSLDEGLLAAHDLAKRLAGAIPLSFSAVSRITDMGDGYEGWIWKMEDGRWKIENGRWIRKTEEP
jgi:hypothetical protein